MTVSRVCTRLEDYPAARRECIVALDLARAFSRRGVVGLGDFGPYGFLFESSGSLDARRFVVSVLGPLIEHDREHGSSYLKTADRFVAVGGRYQAAAGCLHVHVSTLRYRLQRIQDLTGWDFDDDETRFKVQLAFKLYQSISIAGGQLDMHVSA